MEGDAAAAAAAATVTGRVQHITKASSDELLSKFAQVGSNRLALTVVAKNKRKDVHLWSKRQKTVVNNRSNSDDEHICDSPLSSIKSVTDGRSLLPTISSNRRSGTAFIRQLGIGKAKLRAKNIKNKSLFGTIEKTWRKTVKGASKILIEKHYNRHKRLISDIA